MNKNSIINICIILILVFSSCKNEKNITEENLILGFKAISDSLVNSNADSMIIGLNKLTKFKWEKLYIFQPYTPTKIIDSTLGFKWYGSRGTSIEFSETFNLLVFVTDKHIIHYVKLPRIYGDFIKLKSNGPYHKNDAVFTLKYIDFGSYKSLLFFKNQN